MCSILYLQMVGRLVHTNLAVRFLEYRYDKMLHRLRLPRYSVIYVPYHCHFIAISTFLDGMYTIGMNICLLTIEYFVSSYWTIMVQLAYLQSCTTTVSSKALSSIVCLRVQDPCLYSGINWLLESTNFQCENFSRNGYFLTAGVVAG